MLERDLDVAMYRDAVLASGVLVRLNLDETVALCGRLLRLSPRSPTRLLIVYGFFVIDESGSILALPPVRRHLLTAAGELRKAGLGNVEKRLRRAAAGSGIKIGRA